MKAFLEPLCEHAGIVRVGPCAERYGDPYDYAVVYLIEDGTAHVKALTSPDGNFSLAHHRAIVAALQMPVLWQRITDNGVRTMAHTPLHAKHGAKLGRQDDQNKVVEVASHYLDEIKAGRMKVEVIGEIDLGNGKYVRSFVIQE